MLDYVINKVFTFIGFLFDKLPTANQFQVPTGAVNWVRNSMLQYDFIIPMETLFTLVKLSINISIVYLSWRLVWFLWQRIPLISK